MTLLFTCRKCGLQAPTLEGHRCVVASSERQERARKVLSEASERAGVEYRPPRDLPMPRVEYQVLAQPLGGVEAPVKEERKEVRPLTSTNIDPLRQAPDEGARRRGPKGGFDREAYHKAYMKAYMREYMRGWRARRRAGP